MTCPHGTELDPATIAGMHLLGLTIVQAAYIVGSGIARYAIAAPDVMVALLCHALVLKIYTNDDVTHANKEQTALAAISVSTIVQVCDGLER